MNIGGRADIGDEGADVEGFQMLSWRWNVSKAKQITAGRRPAAIITVSEWMGMLRMVEIDQEHAVGVDLTDPLLAIPVPSGGVLIIDGWHRLYKAADTGTETLRAHLLSEEEERTCRTHGGETGPGWQ
ncbi:hypothetical protein [Herbidospora cretacea]|uniref:hypothetical protein n=1 Tax=Herbidospora cretacea TaxID=28444 RepID=UPI0007749F5E|nr:hypothetical protein [Herbidospora cretacea]